MDSKCTKKVIELTKNGKFQTLENSRKNNYWKIYVFWLAWPRHKSPQRDMKNGRAQLFQILYLSEERASELYNRHFIQKSLFTFLKNLIKIFVFFFRMTGRKIVAFGLKTWKTADIWLTYKITFSLSFYSLTSYTASNSSQPTMDVYNHKAIEGYTNYRSYLQTTLPQILRIKGLFFLPLMNFVFWQLLLLLTLPFPLPLPLPHPFPSRPSSV